MSTKTKHKKKGPEVPPELKKRNVIEGPRRIIMFPEKDYEHQGPYLFPMESCLTCLFMTQGVYRLLVQELSPEMEHRNREEGMIEFNVTCTPKLHTSSSLVPFGR